MVTKMRSVNEIDACKDVVAGFSQRSTCWKQTQVKARDYIDSRVILPQDLTILSANLRRRRCQKRGHFYAAVLAQL
jgi:hypothetical protein